MKDLAIQYGFLDGSITEPIPFEEGDTIVAPEGAVILSIIVDGNELVSITVN